MRLAVSMRRVARLLVLSAVVVGGAVPARLAWAGPLDATTPGIADLPTQSDIPELKEAIERYKKGDARGAQEVLKKAAAEHPDLPPPNIMFARMCLSSGSLAEGREALELAVQDDPAYPDAYLILGDLAFREGRVTEAGLVYAKALELSKAYDKDDKRKRDFTIRAAGGLAAVCEARKEWAEALQHLDTWLTIDPQNHTARHHRGIALFGLEKPSDAYKEFEEAAKGDPEQFLPPAVTIGRLFERAGNQDKAMEWLRFAQSKGKDDPRTRLALAQWLWEMGQYQDAHAHAWQALELKKDSLEAKIVLGTILRYLKEYGQAEEHLQQALLQSPSNFTAANQLALALCEQGDENKRARAIEQATVNAGRLAERDPRRAEAYATLAWTNFRAGKVDEAERYIRQAYSTRQVSSDMAYYMATIASERGNKERAQQLLKDALAATGPFAHREEAQMLLDRLAQADSGPAIGSGANQ